MASRSIEDRLLEAQIAIDNSLNIPDILTAVTPYGYGQLVLQEAQDKYNEVMALVAAQQKEYGEQYEATANLQAAWDAADIAYKRSLKSCRILFSPDHKAYGALGLAGTRKKTLSGWIMQVTSFYTNLLGDPDFITVLSQFGYDQAKLAAEYALVQAVMDANAVQDKERGEAQHATKARDVKLDELEAWVSRYKQVAKLALEDKSQLLEQLGWVVPS